MSNKKTGRSRAPAIAAEVERMIVTGELRPGQRIDESALAARFSVSRTPIREALNRIVSIGLAEARPNHGTFVAAISLSEILEIFEVLAELEGVAARLAAKRMSEEQRARLAALAAVFDAGDAPLDAERYVPANAAFHAAIYEGSHNAFLARQAQRIRQRVTPYRRFTLDLPGRVAAASAEHRAIADAIVAGDADRAAVLVREHVRIEREFPDFVMRLSRVLDGG